MATKDTFTFETEVQKVLDILIYSLYTHKEIFLRELISNAADALEKVNYLLLTDKKEAVRDGELPLEITVDFDKKDQVLRIEDTGCGMTYAELKENLGTIARSGSLDFMKLAQEDKKKQLELIGKFGVGFYSVFMVAREVRVHSLSYHKDADSHVWVSSGKGHFQIEKSTRQKARGTCIEIVLKDDEKEFLDSERLKKIINQYSNFVNFPIKVAGKQVNTVSALWGQNKKDISKQDYHTFYRFISNTEQEPLAYAHIKYDVPLQFSAILFVPPGNMERLGFMRYEKGLQLYCRRILIQESNRDLLPPYFRFIHGVVDSEDIDLNISRETIQNNPVLQRVKSSLTHKLIDFFSHMAAKEPETYLKVWQEFGAFFQEGVQSDYSHRDKLLPLLRFASIKQEKADTLISLDEYVTNMAPKQKEIFYYLGPDKEHKADSPHLEIFREKSIDVLLLSDPLSEFMLSEVKAYKDKPFKSVEQADIELPEPEAREKTDDQAAAGPDKKKKKAFFTFVKQTLGEDIIDVQASKRLVDSPVLLVNPEHAPGIQMQKLLAMMNPEQARLKRILEVNLSHPLIISLMRLHTSTPDSTDLKDLVYQLYENAALVSQGAVPQPEEAAKRMERLMTRMASLLLKDMG